MDRSIVATSSSGGIVKLNLSIGNYPRRRVRKIVNLNRFFELLNFGSRPQSPCSVRGWARMGGVAAVRRPVCCNNSPDTLAHVDTAPTPAAVIGLIGDRIDI